MLSPSEQRLARERTYALFSRLYISGISQDLWPALQSIPELAAHLPAELDLDQAAAAHYHTFTDTVLPFESVFRDPSGLIGGEVSTAVAANYGESGFSHTAEADAVGTELAFLAYLCAAESAAWEVNHQQSATRWQDAQRSFLEKHLLGWLPPFTAALASGRRHFFAALGRLTLVLAAEHLTLLGTDEVPQVPLPEPPRLLEEQNTSLRLISHTLLTPPYSGFYLSREAISALARTHRLPRGFGQRRQLLRNLLETAGQYDQVNLVLDDLLALTSDFAGKYQEQVSAAPLLAQWVRPWQLQLAQTQSMLREMRVLLEPGS